MYYMLCIVFTYRLGGRSFYFFFFFFFTNDFCETKQNKLEHELEPAWVLWPWISSALKEPLQQVLYCPLPCDIPWIETTTFPPVQDTPRPVANWFCAKISRLACSGYFNHPCALPDGMEPSLRQQVAVDYFLGWPFSNLFTLDPLAPSLVHIAFKSLPSSGIAGTNKHQDKINKTISYLCHNTMVDTHYVSEIVDQ